MTRQVVLGPGLYQVRVAVRDEGTGRVGGARAWVEIPDLRTRTLALSSLVVGARRAASSASGGPTALAEIDIARRFRRDADMRVFLFAYNAARGAGDARPDVAIQMQLVHDNRTVMKTGFTRMAIADADVGQLSCAADLSLRGLPAGRYALQATVLDRIAGRSLSQQTRFEID